MEKGQAEMVVKVLAILYWIGAAFSAIFGLMALFGGSALGALGGMFGGFFGAFVAVFGVVLIVLAALYAFVGRGLWQHKSWAKIVAIVLAVLSLLSFPIGTIVGAATIYFLGFNEEVKALFE